MSLLRWYRDTDRPDSFMHRFATVTNTFDKVKDRVYGIEDDEGSTPDKGKGRTQETPAVEDAQDYINQSIPSTSCSYNQQRRRSNRISFQGSPDGNIGLPGPNTNIKNSPMDEKDVLDRTYSKWVENVRRKQDADRGSGHATPLRMSEPYRVDRRQIGNYERQVTATEMESSLFIVYSVVLLLIFIIVPNWVNSEMTPNLGVNSDSCIPFRVPIVMLS